MGAGDQTTLEMSIGSSYALMDRVAALVEEAAGRIGLSEDDGVDLMIAVTEAVTNAIQHGNTEDESKQVHIRMEIAPSRVSIWVRDEGTGFDLKSIPDPRNPDNLLNESGRGILMIRAFMDDVEFSVGPTGTTVRMEKQFSTKEPEGS